MCSCGDPATRGPAGLVGRRLVPDDKQACDLSVPDPDVVGKDEFAGKVGAIEGAVIDGPHDGLVMVLTSLPDFHGDVVAFDLLGYPPPYGVATLNLAPVVVYVSVGGEEGDDGVSVMGIDCFHVFGCDAGQFVGH